MTARKSNKNSDRKGLYMSDSAKQKYAELFMAELDAMEEHEYKIPWVSPHNGMPCNLYRKGRPYRGCNVFWLMMLMQLRGFNTPYFITKTQMENQDGDLKYKGLTANASVAFDENGMPVLDENFMPKINVEKRFPVSFFKRMHSKDGELLSDDEWCAMTDEEQEECRSWWSQKNYLVYNIDQTNLPTLYPDEYRAMTEVPEHDYEVGQRDNILDRMIYCGEWICPIRFGGAKAFFSPMQNYIQLPKRENFLGDELFYATAIHEMAHSTGLELKRELGNSFGTEAYATEELIAELSSACVCSMLGIGKLLDEQHIAYVDSWRKALTEEKDFIPVVIDHVQRCANFILRKYNEVAKAHEMPKLLIAV